ncbi:MAG TPA: nucleoside triphosphate pyrophosphatase [Gaiellaceae bacterium]|nr:nucleoside triphosphate pyrophosphatase [Gaiellaceae bacterium]
MSAPPAPPLLLASRSPQRRAILEQLAIPFEAVVPQYDEELSGADPIAEVERHAQGKARSVAGIAGDRPVLGVDTEVVLDGRVYGKPADEGEAEAMLEELSGQTHEVVSGLCLLTPAWEELRHAVTRVSIRALTPRELGLYVVSEEWRERAGGYAIQGLGAALVDRIDGDYLNVVGLPTALLVELLAERFPGVYGFG